MKWLTLATICTHGLLATHLLTGCGSQESNDAHALPEVEGQSSENFDPPSPATLEAQTQTVVVPAPVVTVDGGMDLKDYYRVQVKLDCRKQCFDIELVLPIVYGVYGQTLHACDRYGAECAQFSLKPDQCEPEPSTYKGKVCHTAYNN